jgi:ATP-dependent DNA ligase
MALPIKPPYPPMEALSVGQIPTGNQWQYEPKWDGFRCLAFRDGAKVNLQSKASKPLGRYFPELVEDLQKLKAPKFVLDGEIVIPIDGAFSFNQLLQRIHPAQSRIEKLSAESPARLIVFDLLVDAEARISRGCRSSSGGRSWRRSPKSTSPRSRGCRSRQQRPIGASSTSG